MRNSLLQLIENTIIYEYDLPNQELDIKKTIFSTENDKCYSSNNNDSLVEIIYNSIIDYSFNEFELSTKDYNDLHTIAFQERLRYNEDDAPETRLKYGFFGEVLLYAVLRILFNTETIISKGYFYNPLENSESKGYDAYHLIETDSTIELWFGETKFHQSYISGVNDVLSKINTSLSDTYLRKNLLAIRKNKDNLNTVGSKIEEILKNWERNPSIVITDELIKYQIKLVYPIFLLFEKNKIGFDESIKHISKYIERKHTVTSFELSIPYSIFFILLPLDNVREVKLKVLEWIELRKPLLS
jgi:hypothetical protein